MLAGVLLVLLTVGATAVFAADTTRGAKIYNQHCVDCHGPSGSGQMPGVPDFTHSDRLFQSDQALAETIKRGKNVMPGFQGILTDEQIFDVIAYLRTLH